MKNLKCVKHFFAILIVFLLYYGFGNGHAQQIIGLSVGYENFPSVELEEPIADAKDLEIRASAWSMGAAFPMMFAQGKIIVLNQINYKRTDLRYKNFPQGGAQIDQMQSVDYTFFMIDSLSQKWKLVAVVTPGLASDFEASISGDDFTFGAVFGFIRQLNKNFQLGFAIHHLYIPNQNPEQN